MFARFGRANKERDEDNERVKLHRRTDFMRHRPDCGPKITGRGTRMG